MSICQICPLEQKDCFCPMKTQPIPSNFTELRMMAEEARVND